MDHKGNTNFDWNQDLDKFNIYLLRYSEIGLKGKKTRNQMEIRLINNISVSLKNKGKNGTFIRERGRIFVISHDDISSEISKIMGIKSFSSVRVIRFKDKKILAENVKDLFIEKIRNKKYAVYTRRTGSHDFTSMEMDRMIGDLLFPYSSGVDLKNPDIRIEIEIRNNLAYVMLHTLEGPGGLPLGTEGKMVSLISGGIDSPVSTWMMMRRGSPVDLIFMSLANPIDTKHFLTKALILYSNWYSGYNPYIYIVDASRLITDYLFKGKMKYANVSYKRKMYEIADNIAQKIGAYGIITGESSGQVSSQTPENIYELSMGLKTVIHRPLIGMDKDWIIDQARKIGTFHNDSTEEFCALFGERPITKVKHEELMEDIERISSYFPNESEIIRIRGNEIEEYLNRIGNPEYEVRSIEKIPKQSIIVDVRDPLSFKSWHPDGAININPGSLDQLDEINRDKKPVVFYCKQGLQSAYMAGRLRKKGYEAYFASEKIFRNQILEDP
ncbi:MAG: hypothetical protein AMDU5_GPLC00003G0210 [Thermoplasmatales archaeon Gpl]|nr:MAG: hypothetical protein AMDU5_GPLC00003G0210 [Thermoplasmatales archaeon Gpl]